MTTTQANLGRLKLGNEPSVWDGEDRECREGACVGELICRTEELWYASSPSR